VGLGWLLLVGFLEDGFRPRSIVFVRVSLPSTFTNSCQVLLLLGFWVWVWVFLAWLVILGLGLGFGVFFWGGSYSGSNSGFLFFWGVFKVGWVLWVGLGWFSQVLVWVCMTEVGVWGAVGFVWVYLTSTNWVFWLLWVGWVGFFGLAYEGVGFLGSWVLLYRFLGSFFLVGFVF
jgi:hypothetical protein